MDRLRLRKAAVLLLLATFLQSASARPQEPLPMTQPATPESHSFASIPATSEWPPPELQAAAADEQCPRAEVVKGATARIDEMMRNLLRFTATEQVQHSEWKSGKWTKPVQVRFEYMAEIEKFQSGILHLSETRDGGMAWEKFPAGLATLGIPATVLIIHPSLIDGYDITCEGRGEWNHRPAWVLYFQQRADKTPRLRRFVVQQQEYLLKMKGRAWIDEATFNPMHIETDLMEPVPQITLFRDHLAIDYGPVHFVAHNEDLWLPKKAEMYMDFRRHRIHRVHTFSDFLLFAVDVGSKDNAPPSE